MDRLIAVNQPEDVLPSFRGTPIELLLEYHNLERPLDGFSRAQLLIGMCMDHRKSLRIPDNFAYIIRSGGASMRDSDFFISYAIAVGGVKSIALIGHNDCGMVNLQARRELFVQGLVGNAGLKMETAEEHFDHSFSRYEIGNEVDSVLRDANRLRLSYPRIQVAPLLYRIEDNRLFQIRET